MQPDTKQIYVSQLWQRLEEMERELRFDGKAYPGGMCPFPFRLKGQGFFPGGDGLWRDDSDLSAAKDGKLLQGGVVFLANDFGVLSSFQRLEERSFENVPTWRNIKHRAVGAGIPVASTFFTNAIMGLRVDGTALTPKSWQKMGRFSEFCGEFLDFQLDILKPRLTVIMGPQAKTAFDALGNSFRAGRVLYTTHPYGDFNFSQKRKESDIAELKAAWDN